MSLEDFHTKAMRLVTQAGYEGDAKDQVLRDIIISGITSEKIRAKIVKEGHKVTLNCVMEIASFHPMSPRQNATLPQGPPWSWTLDNLSLSRK